MDKKFVLGFVINSILACSIANAQIVTVDGIGSDKGEATRDAMRNAVEKVVGTFIDSRTLLENSVVAMDEVYAKSQGFVKNIQIVSEENSGGMYRIKANVDVDTNPNSVLMNRISTIVLLNDPRIATNAVIMGGESDSKKSLINICEGAVNRKLIDMGFNHVVNNYSNHSIHSDKECDYIVRLELSFRGEAVTLPKFSVPGVNNSKSEDFMGKSGEFDDSGSSNTGLQRVNLTTSAKIINAHTKEIINHFTTNSVKLGNTVGYAEQLAVQDISDIVAQKVAEAFAKKAANSNSSSQIIARADSYDTIVKLQKALSSLSCVNAAYIRSYENGKAKIDIDASQNVNFIYRMLRERNQFGLYMENMTDSVLEISVN